MIAGAFYSIKTKIQWSIKFDQAGAAITAIITSSVSAALQFKAFGGGIMPRDDGRALMKPGVT